MTDIRCPSCGKDNPDFLDVCQFCQTPLTPDSTVHIGDKPTKKNTGELEPILPEWLRDMRQQGRESMEEGELSSSATQPRIQKNEAPDLLAGLASQSDDDDDEIPDWLASINPVAKPKPSEPSSPEPSVDFFAQFNKSKAAPEKPSKVSEPPQEETPSWMGRQSQSEAPAEKDELSAWLSSASKESDEPFAFQSGTPQDASDWASRLGSSEPAPEEKEDLSWLHNLEASAKQAETPSQPEQDAGWNFDAPSVPASSASQEDLSWLNNLGGTPEPAQPSQQEDLSWLNALGGTSEPVQPVPSQPSEQDDLSWLNSLGGTSEPVSPTTPQPSQPEDLSWLDTLGGTSEPVQPAVTQPSRSDDLGWLNNLDGTSEPAQPTPAPSSSDDMSWLDNLGGIAEPSQPTSALSSSQDDLGWLKDIGESSEPAQQIPTSQENLGWLDTLGGVPEPVQPTPAPSTLEGDLDWLSKLGEASAPEQPEPTQSTSQDDLDWLKNFAASTSAEPSQPTAAGSQDLDWLDTLGGTTETSQPAPAESATSQGDIDWLASLGELSASSTPASAKPFGTTDELTPPKDFDENLPSHVSPFVPRRTAPLGGDTFNDDMPDWLKSATEETPILPLGASALDHLRDTPRKPAEEGTPPSKPGPASVGSDVFSSPGESQSLSSQELDSLFSMEMPDWLSKPQPDTNGVTPQQVETPARDESLSPVELPSWVQAMRPVESVLSETGGPSIESQPTEKEGPLAGLRGVIPSAPIGSSRRPKAISLKLLATDEQQAGASLFEQILAGESAPRVVTSLSALTSQNVLRWVIAGVLFVVLGAIIFLRSQLMPVSAILPPDVGAASSAIAAVPENSSVLVVVDYEPSLAGEMEAVSAPVLNQLILSRQPRLVFLSTSPNGAGLIERLLATVQITAPNLGYLPGGSAGIMGFMAQPNRVIPSATAQSFSEYVAVIVLTDHAESGRTWVEQLDVAKQGDPSLATQSLILVTSAQAGPLLQPYVSSKQVAGLVNGLADAARFEYANNIPSENRIARNYWDAFGIGILLAMVLIIIGSVWSLVVGIRARRANGEQG